MHAARGRGRRTESPSGRSPPARPTTPCAYASRRCCTTPPTSSASIPGLQKDGVEKHLQELLAEHTIALGDGMSLVRREFMTAIGPVDLLCKDAGGGSVAVEIKRAATSTVSSS